MQASDRFNVNSQLQHLQARAPHSRECTLRAGAGARVALVAPLRLRLAPLR